jgi:hypothetical protein
LENAECHEVVASPENEGYRVENERRPGGRRLLSEPLIDADDSDFTDYCIFFNQRNQ